MAKNVSDAIRDREAAHANRHVGAERSTAGSRVQGFTRDYSQPDVDRIAAERDAMRERLLRQG